MKADGDSETAHFFETARKVSRECVEKVAAKYSVPIAAEVRLYDAAGFNMLLSDYTFFGTKPTAFRDPFGYFVAIDVGTILSDSENLESFVVNFVLNVIEELLHEAFPSDNELEIKIKTHQVTENYLEWEIPNEYKEGSLKRAADPNY